MILQVLLAFLLHFASATQVHFNLALHVPDTARLCKLLQDYDEAQIDPSVFNDEALILSCKEEHASHELLRLLLKDNRVDPNARNCYAFKEAVKFLNYDLVEAFLEDGRVCVEPLYKVSSTKMNILSPWWIRDIRNIPKSIMQLTSPSEYHGRFNSFERLTQETFLALNNSNFDLLIRRAKGDYEIRAILIRKFIESRNAPDSILHDPRILCILARLHSTSTLTIGRSSVRMIRVAREFRFLSDDIAWLIAAFDAELEGGAPTGHPSSNPNVAKNTFVRGCKWVVEMGYSRTTRENLYLSMLVYVLCVLMATLLDLFPAFLQLPLGILWGCCICISRFSICSMFD